jgi:hypothetical protein
VGALKTHSGTFAVEPLLAGVPPETVSLLLGHSSVKITEKHYKRSFSRIRASRAAAPGEQTTLIEAPSSEIAAHAVKSRYAIWTISARGTALARSASKPATEKPIADHEPDLPTRHGIGDDAHVRG